MIDYSFPPYQILREETGSLSALTQQVNALIDKGYAPLGGPVVEHVTTSDGVGNSWTNTWFMQAMVREQLNPARAGKGDYSD